MKYVWYVQCPVHPSINKHFIKKTESKAYFAWHLKDCFHAEPPELIEAPFVG